MTMCDGEVIYQDGKFTKVDKTAALKALHDDLSKALADDEVERRKLSVALLPHVRKFYAELHRYLEAPAVLPAELDGGIYPATAHDAGRHARVRDIFCLAWACAAKSLAPASDSSSTCVQMNKMSRPKNPTPKNPNRGDDRKGKKGGKQPADGGHNKSNEPAGHQPLPYRWSRLYSRNQPASSCAGARGRPVRS